MAKKLRLWAAYLEEPIMVKGDDIFRHKEINDLLLSEELKSKLRDWDDEYQNNFDQNDPLGSDFPSSEAADLHAQTGMELAQLLQEELGGEYVVEYKA